MKIALAVLALLTFAACSGGGSSPLPATGVASSSATRKPLDTYGGTGGPMPGAFSAVAPIGNALNSFNGGW